MHQRGGESAAVAEKGMISIGGATAGVMHRRNLCATGEIGAGSVTASAQPRLTDPAAVIMTVEGKGVDISAAKSISSNVVLVTAKLLRQSVSLITG